MTVCAHSVALVGIATVKAGVERVSVTLAGGRNDLGGVIMLNAEHGISVFSGTLGVLNEALNECLVSCTNGAVNEIRNVVATTVCIGDNLSEHVCVCIELNVRSGSVNTRYRADLSTVCVERYVRIADVESNRGLFAKIERYRGYGGYRVNFSSRCSCARVISDNGFNKSYYARYLFLSIEFSEVLVSFLNVDENVLCKSLFNVGCFSVCYELSAVLRNGERERSRYVLSVNGYGYYKLKALSRIG